MRTSNIGLQCRHIYEIIEEYVSRGKNILNERVKARMALVKCEKCGEDNRRLIQAL